MTTEIVEGELLPDVIDYPAAPSTLFRTDDPRIALERMSDLARVLVDLVRSQGLAVRIRGGEHLRVEAWRALGGMVGVYPITSWSKPNEAGDGFLVRVEARTRAGELVGASEAECSRAESTWATRDAHALRAMAETRATSRALRGPLGQIVVLAGYEPAGAEEMPLEAAEPEPEQERRSPADPVAATKEQWQQITALIASLQDRDPVVDWTARARELAGAPGNMLTQGGAAVLIDRLEVERALAERVGGEGEAA